MEDENKVSEVVGKLPPSMAEARKSNFIRLFATKDNDIVAMYWKKKPKLDPKVKAQRAAERHAKSEKNKTQKEIDTLEGRIENTKKNLESNKAELSALEATPQSIAAIKNTTEKKRIVVGNLTNKLKEYTRRLSDAKTKLKGL